MFLNIVGKIQCAKQCTLLNNVPCLTMYLTLFSSMLYIVANIVKSNIVLEKYKCKFDVRKLNILKLLFEIHFYLCLNVSLNNNKT